MLQMCNNNYATLQATNLHKRKKTMSVLEDSTITNLLENNPELIGKRIGLVFFNLPTSSMRAELCESISRRVGTYNMILFNTDYPVDSHNELEIIKEAKETHDISGFIIWPSANFDQYAGKYLTREKIPFVLVPHVSDIYQGQFNEVCTPTDATSLAISHLVTEGAQKIGFLIGEKTYNSVYVQQRYMCYRNVLLENNLNVYEPLCIPDHPEEENFQKFDQKIISQVQKFDGIFAATDFLMALLYRRCVNGGIRIPQDLLLTSIDNTPIALCLDVTSIEQNFPLIAFKAVDLIISLILNTEQSTQQFTVPSELIIRSSSKKIPT